MVLILAQTVTTKKKYTNGKDLKLGKKKKVLKKIKKKSLQNYCYRLWN